MLGPSKSAPDYEEQLKLYRQDNSSWGTDASKVDMMKSPLNQLSPTGPTPAQLKDPKR